MYEAFGHVELLPWAAIAFTVTSVAMAPLISKLLPVLSLRLQLIFYGAILFIGSVVQGSASTLEVVIVGRAIAGIGGAGSYQWFVTLTSINLALLMRIQLACM